MTDPLLAEACDVTSGKRVRGAVFLASDVASYVGGTVIDVGRGRYT